MVVRADRAARVPPLVRRRLLLLPAFWPGARCCCRSRSSASWSWAGSVPAPPRAPRPPCAARPARWSSRRRGRRARRGTCSPASPAPPAPAVRWDRPGRRELRAGGARGATGPARRGRWRGCDGAGTARRCRWRRRANGTDGARRTRRDRAVRRTWRAGTRKDLRGPEGRGVLRDRAVHPAATEHRRSGIGPAWLRVSGATAYAAGNDTHGLTSMSLPPGDYLLEASVHVLAPAAAGALATVLQLGRGRHGTLLQLAATDQGRRHHMKDDVCAFRPAGFAWSTTPRHVVLLQHDVHAGDDVERHGGRHPGERPARLLSGHVQDQSGRGRRTGRCGCRRSARLATWLATTWPKESTRQAVNGHRRRAVALDAVVHLLERPRGSSSAESTSADELEASCASSSRACRPGCEELSVLLFAHETGQTHLPPSPCCTIVAPTFRPPGWSRRSASVYPRACRRCSSPRRGHGRIARRVGQAARRRVAHLEAIAIRPGPSTATTPSPPRLRVR